jgi:hypothetical protein
METIRRVHPEVDDADEYGGRTVGTIPGPTRHLRPEGEPVILLRRLLGDVLRERRRSQERTLREVSAAARVSLGYLSEVERGQKEASSELRGAICDALDVPMSEVMREVSDNLALAEGIPVVPAPAEPGRMHVTNVAA